MLGRLRAQDPTFFAVPGIDSREPATSFKVRGRDRRVDFLTPASKIALFRCISDLRLERARDVPGMRARPRVVRNMQITKTAQPTKAHAYDDQIVR